VEEIDGIPLPVFDVEEPTKSLLLMFVASAPKYVPDLVHALELVGKGRREYCGFTNECIEVKFYKDRVVIEDYTVEENVRCQLELPIIEAMTLVLDWVNVLKTRVR
jgi:hypothetical protein